jgi:voltage-gated potassium channel
VIFEAETPLGKAFDVGLLIAIAASVTVVLVESIPDIDPHTRALLRGLEWFFTIIFTIEYVLRLIAVKKPMAYARSFFGIIDFIAIAPTFLSLILVGSQSLAVVRALRLLRVFRIMKLTQFVGEAQMLRTALAASSRKIIIFVGAVITLVIIIGSIMYLVEGTENGFNSIPHAIYWAIVTLTTVGYGDIAPQTDLGRFLASIVMLIGYGIIAVPTGIVTVELAEAIKAQGSTRACLNCGESGHDSDADFCKFCGGPL